MRRIPVTKMSGTGNDFLMIDNRGGLLAEGEAAALAKSACPRRVSAGADGVILIEKSSKPGHDYRMRIFNADGSEAEMCGNGSRCVAVFAVQVGAAGREQIIETLAGTLSAVVNPDGSAAKVQLSQPGAYEVRKGVDVLGQPVDLHCMNTGVPHAIQFVPDAKAVDVKRAGACVRHHDAFKPRGTNANFVEVTGPGSLKLRTYERGVEDETFACGTGATAAAIIAAFAHGLKSPVRVETSGGALLTIHFELQGNSAARPYLEGSVDTIYAGDYFWR